MLLYLFFEVQIKTPGGVYTTLALFATQCAMIFKTRQFRMAASEGRAIQLQTREEPASTPRISPWVGMLDGEAVLGALHLCIHPNPSSSITYGCSSWLVSHASSACTILLLNL